MTLKEFYKEIFDREYYTTYIVQLAYKYNDESEYTVSNEILEFSGEYGFEWLNDWNEGQEDVKVCNYVTLEEVFDDHM